MDFKLVLPFCLVLALFFTFGCVDNDVAIPYTTSQLIARSTDLNYTLFREGFYDGNCLGIDNNLLTVIDCNGGTSPVAQIFDGNIYYYGIMSGDNNSFLIDLNLGENNIYNASDVNATRFFGDGSGLTGIENTDDLNDVMARGNTTSYDLLMGDNVKAIFGTGNDASIYYDGTNLVVNPAEVGSGLLDIEGSVLIDVTNTEAFLVRKNADAGDVFIVDTTNKRVGIGVTPTSQFHLLGNNTDFYSVYMKGGTVTGTGYGQYIYLEGGEGASDSTAGYSEGQVGGANSFRAGAGGASNAGSGDFSYSQGGNAGLSSFIGAAGGSSFASGASTYSAGGEGSSFSMSGGTGGASIGGGEVYSGRGGDFTMSSGSGGHGYATQDNTYIEAAYGGQFNMTSGPGGNAYNYYPNEANAKNSVTLIGGTATGLFVTTGAGGRAISDSGDTTCSGNGGNGGQLVYRTGNGGNGTNGGAINGGNGGYFQVSAGKGGNTTGSTGTGGNGGYLIFESGRKGTGNTDGTDGYIEFKDGYNNVLLKLLGDTTKSILMPNDNQKLLIGAGQDTGIYFDTTNLVLDGNVSDSNTLNKVWITSGGNVVANSFNMRSDVKTGNQLENIKDGTELLNLDGSINHKAFDECYVGIKATDFNKPVIEEYNCNYLDENNEEVKEVCERTIYPFTKVEDSIRMDCVLAKAYQALANVNNAMKVGDGTIDTINVLAENIYTKSKVPLPEVNYCKMIQDANIYDKASHYAYVEKNGRFVLDAEYRWVVLEGCEKQKLDEMCIESNHFYSWCPNYKPK